MKNRLLATSIVALGMFYSAEGMKYELAMANIQMIWSPHENVHYDVLPDSKSIYKGIYSEYMYIPLSLINISNERKIKEYWLLDDSMSYLFHLEASAFLFNSEAGKTGKSNHILCDPPLSGNINKLISSSSYLLGIINDNQIFENVSLSGIQYSFNDGTVYVKTKGVYRYGDLLREVVHTYKENIQDKNCAMVIKHAIENLNKISGKKIVDDETIELIKQIGLRPRLSDACIFYAPKYFNTLDDHINLTFVSKRFRGNMEKSHYNPVSVNTKTVEFFTNIETLPVYSKDDEYLEGERIQLYVDWYNPVEFSKRSNNKNIEFKKVAFDEDGFKHLLKTEGNELVKKEIITLADVNAGYIKEKIKSIDLVKFVKESGVKITEIGDSCFSECFSLTSITLPTEVTKIGYGCFGGCHSLTSINIPSTLKGLGDWCFHGCYSLKSITIHNGVTKIGTSCFSDCHSLTSINIPSTLKELGDSCFSECFSLTSITLPPGVTNIGIWCFRGCSSLKSITLPNEVTNIGLWCFEGCSSLKSITLPNGVTKIRNCCFSGCTKLQFVNIMKSDGDIKQVNVKNVERKAYKIKCEIDKLHKEENDKQAIDCPTESLNNISGNNSAFEDITSAWQEINVGNESIAEDCQYNDSIKQTEWRPRLSDACIFYASKYFNTLADHVNLLNVSKHFRLNMEKFHYNPISVNEKTVKYFPNVETLHIYNENDKYLEGGRIFQYVDWYNNFFSEALKIRKENPEKNIEFKKVVLAKYSFAEFLNKNGEELVPKGIMTIIHDKGGYYKHNIQSIDLVKFEKEYNVRIAELGDGCFRGYESLESLILPSSLEKIGCECFWECKSLKKIIITGQITEIERQCFYYCNFLKEIVIPNSVTKLAEGSFQKCVSLESITLPGTLEEIGDECFSGCPKLSTIKFVRENGEMQTVNITHDYNPTKQIQDELKKVRHLNLNSNK